MFGNMVVKFFEGLAKFMYALLPTVLPYSTPLPIAMITAGSAERFFNMDPWSAGIFVFSLEGLGVWSTTTFIDRVVEWVRSRNSKVAVTAFIMFLVVLAYLTILIMLNVALKGDQSVTYRAVVTLICFLPFIAGVLNGFHRIQLKDQDLFSFQHDEQLRLAREQQQLEEDRRIEEANRVERLRLAELDTQVKVERAKGRTQKGGSPLSVKTSWTDLTQKQKDEIKSLGLPIIMRRYNVSRGTAFNWRTWAKEGR